MVSDRYAPRVFSEKSFENYKFFLDLVSRLLTIDKIRLHGRPPRVRSGRAIALCFEVIGLELWSLYVRPGGCRYGASGPGRPTEPRRTFGCQGSGPRTFLLSRSIPHPLGNLIPTLN